MTYAATLPVLLLKAGTHAAYIGALIGVLRGVAFVVNMFFGRIGDRVSPRHVIIACEFGAAVGSGLILYSWREYGTAWLVPFFFTNVIRVFFTSLQAGSSQKLGKLVDDSLGWKGKTAIIMNGLSNGALLIGGLLSLMFFDQLSIELIVWVDFATFALNGLLIFFIPDTERNARKEAGVSAVQISIAKYYRLQPKLALLDVCLALCFCGANVLNIRLLVEHPEWVPLMPAIFGAAAFITSFYRKLYPADSRLLWGTLAMMLLSLGLFHDMPGVVLVLFTIQNFIYWIIFHSISRQFMNNMPVESYAAAAAGRNAMTTGILASGEFWVGATKGLNLAIEMGWRAAIALMVSLFKGWRK